MARDRVSRIIAARKGVKTRAENAARAKNFNEFYMPSTKRMNDVLTVLVRKIRPMQIRVRWNPIRDTGTKLKHGVTHGTLVGFQGGNLLLVRPDGYKRPQAYHPSFWEVIA